MKEKKKAKEATAVPVAATAAMVTARVLVVDASLPNRRLIREALTAFLNCEVDDAATAEHACERALQREYVLFIFAICLPDMSGTLLDRVLARIYPRLHTGTHTAPPVIFLVRGEDATAYHEISRDARVRGSVPLPLNLDTLMNITSNLLPART